MLLFDKKFGKGFLRTVPLSPGTYRFYSSGGNVIYVGKAVCLRRRLAQYRNPRRLKRHRKMRQIVTQSARLEWTASRTRLEAEMEEVRLIQELKPRENIASKFSFLYPMLGIREQKGVVSLLYTTSPDRFPGYEKFGAFRSRRRVAEAFFALARLLAFIAHPEPSSRARDRIAYSHERAFRKLSLPVASLASFMRGESDSFLEDLSLALLEKAAARKRAEEVSLDLKCLRRFWKREALRLFRAVQSVPYTPYPVAQADLEILYLRAKARLALGI